MDYTDRQVLKEIAYGSKVSIEKMLIEIDPSAHYPIKTYANLVLHLARTQVAKPEAHRAADEEMEDKAVNPRQFRVSYSGTIIYIDGMRCSSSPLATRVYQAILETIGKPRAAEGMITEGADGRFIFVEFEDERALDFDDHLALARSAGQG